VNICFLLFNLYVVPQLVNRFAGFKVVRVMKCVFVGLTFLFNAHELATTDSC